MIVLPPPIAEIFETMDGLLVKNTFSGRMDRDSANAAYRRNNLKVRETVPADRLLVFTPADGWEPLCRFLGVPVPDHSRAATRAMRSGPTWAASLRAHEGLVALPQSLKSWSITSGVVAEALFQVDVLAPRLGGDAGRGQVAVEPPADVVGPASIALIAAHRGVLSFE